MEEFFKHLAWAGPLAIVALAIVLKAIRTRFFKKPPQSPTQAAEAPPAALQALERSSGPTPYDTLVKTHNAWVVAGKREISHAYQEAMHQAVELAQPVLLLIFKPEDIKTGEPLCRIEPYPLDDPRRQGLNHDGEVVIVDYRSISDENWGERFLPRHLREKYAARQRLREESLQVGALHHVEPVTPSVQLRYESTASPALEAKVQAFTSYRQDLDQRAEQAFQEELVKIKADAEHMARNVFAKGEGRQQELAAEASERGVAYEVVLEEFVQLVVKGAEDQARATYTNVNYSGGGLLGALTPERLKASTMFQHETRPE